MRRAKRSAAAEIETQPARPDPERLGHQFSALASDMWRRRTEELRASATKVTDKATRALESPKITDAKLSQAAEEARQELAGLLEQQRHVRSELREELRRDIMGHTAQLPNEQRRSILDTASQQFVPPQELTKLGETVERLEYEKATKAEAAIRADHDRPQSQRQVTPSPSPSP